MNMAGAALNPAAGGPVGGGIMMMNNAGGSPAVPNNSERNPEQIKIMLNTYVYEYVLKLRYYEIARALVKDKDFEIRSVPKQSPGHRKDGDTNGVDGDGMDTDMKDDIPDDLPRPSGVGADSLQGNGFLFEWFSVFSDLFAAHRGNSNRTGNPTPATQYLIQHQQLQRMRENQQNPNLGRPSGMMNPNFMRNQQMRNGMVNGEMQKRLTPQQMQMIQQGKAHQQMQQQMARGDQPEGDPHARPATPADGENGGSPSKRPRLDVAPQFNAGMMPNGRPGVPGAGQQGMMIQAGFNPNMNQAGAQFRQNGGMPPKAMAGNMANGMMAMPGAGSPMMQNMTQFPEGTNIEMYQNRMVAQGMQGVPNGQSGNHALQDYQMQLMLLEQQNKKRLMMARQEQHESTNPRDGQPMPGGVNMQPPGMSPGSRTGTSPNPTDQMKRTPQLGGMPGSPSAGDMQGRSPAPMNFMNGIQQPDFSQAMFMKDGQMMGPGGPNMRPPTSADINAMNRQQQQGPQLQAGQGVNRMQFAGGQPMQQQQSQGQPQPVGTPGQREMPPPQAPAGPNSAQRGNQPASPATSNAPPTPSQANKPNPKNKKGGNKDANDRKRPTKKNSTANAPGSEENPPATPTTSTPITPVHGGQFNNTGAKGVVQGVQQPNQQAQSNAGMPPAQQQMSAPDLQPNGFPDFSAPDNFNLDFSTLENSDVLENFDFDSFLNTSNDDGAFTFDSGMVDGFGMDPTEN